MRRLHVPRYVGGGFIAPTQAETTAWIASVVTNGGTVSDARAAIVNQFIYAEKQAGTWALTDDYWGLWAENASQALTSLKQLRLATAVAAPVFVADRGYTFDGTTQYINTGFIGNTHAVNMTIVIMRVAVYDRGNVSSGGVSFGVESGTHITLNTRNTTSGGRLQSKMGSTVLMNSTTPISDSRGWTVCYMASASDSGWYKNGVLVETIANTPTFVVLPAHAIYIAARNQAGTASAFRPTSYGFAVIGGSLTPAQELAQYNNVQTWATAVGANV